MSNVDPTSCGFANVFSYQLFTKKPNSKKKLTENSKDYSSRILISTVDLYLSFIISNQALNIQRLNPIFEKLQKICSI